MCDNYCPFTWISILVKSRFFFKPTYFFKLTYFFSRRAHFLLNLPNGSKNYQVCSWPCTFAGFQSNLSSIIERYTLGTETSEKIKCREVFVLAKCSGSFTPPPPSLHRSRQFPEVAHDFWSFALPSIVPRNPVVAFAISLGHFKNHLLRSLKWRRYGRGKKTRRREGCSLLFIGSVSLHDEFYKFVSDIRAGREESPYRESFEKTTKTRTPWRHIRSFALLSLLSPSPFVLSFSLIPPHCAALKIMAACNRLLIIWIRRWFLMMPPTPEMVK